MHTSLKNVTERAQKYDFSVNIPIYIAYKKSTARHFVSESWLNVIVFFHLTYPWRRSSNFKMHPSLKNVT